MIDNDEIDQKLSYSKTKNRSITSHFEGYLGAIRDQEIPPNSLSIKGKLMLVLHHQETTSADNASQMSKMLTTLSHHVTISQQGITYHFVMTL